MKKSQLDLFGNVPDDLPLFSQTAQKGSESIFIPGTKDPLQLDFFNCSKCRDSKQIKVKNKMQPCPYCRS